MPRKRFPAYKRNWRRPRRRKFLFVHFLFSTGMMIVFITGTVTVVRFMINLIVESRHRGLDMHESMFILDFGRVFGLGFLAIFFLIIAFRFARRTMREFTNPIEEIIQASEAVAQGDLTTRVKEIGGRGVRQLMVTFNRMVSELETVDQQRRNLTADVAHELRTPLHILQGNIEAILDGVYEADPETLNGMLDETHTLTRLVDDLQTLSLAEAGELHLNQENVDISELLKDVATSFSGLADKENIALVVNAEEKNEVLGDVGRLDQVLSNLVANALRYTPSDGEITLSTRQHNNVIEIQVSDTGAGIPVEDLPHIFNRFYRADKSRNREKGGAGLGLAIARQLVELHRGTIAVNSEVGNGTTFTIALPMVG